MQNNIKTFISDTIDFIFKYYLQIIVFALGVGYLYLFGRSFGINQRISDTLQWFAAGAWRNKFEIVDVLLTIATTITALFAIIISIKANSISKTALEIERPVLDFTCEKFDKDKGQQIIKLKNIGNSEAECIEFYLINEDGRKEISLPVNNLSYGVSPIIIPIEPDNYTTPFMVKYTNSVTKKTYIQSGEVRKESNQVHQIYSSKTSIVNNAREQNLQLSQNQ